jgi:hypothetical protein
MKGHVPPRHRTLRSAQLATASLVALAAAAPACLSRPVERIEPRTTSTVIERLTQSAVDKIDLLLAIDNSASMLDKQQILNAAVPDLVNRLVNPICLDQNQQPLPKADQPTSPTAPCPNGSMREFSPIVDIHIGIVSSSLGGRGADVCEDEKAGVGGCIAKNFSNNDHGHLVTRKSVCEGGIVPTYTDKGFLAWDPTQGKQTPPGEIDAQNLITTVTDLVIGTGQVGCGFEAQNESWFRFLADPEPYETITVQSGKGAVKEGTDEFLLQQRKDFLRPDSLLAIVMLTDENDCSVREGGGNFALHVSKGGNYRMPRPRTECATDPNSECCLPCNAKAPASCADDSLNCGADGSATLSPDDDPLNMRCVDNKRRFGRDYLYPTQRYVNALTLPQLNLASADLGPSAKSKYKPNPLFTDLNPDDDNTTIRDSGLVFLAGIVGVPWQLIRREVDAEGKELDQTVNLEFKTVSEMTKDGTWDRILGDPAKYIPASDAHMIESIDARPGLAPVTTPDDQLDPIHGREWNTRENPLTDLQFACIFELPTPTLCNATTSCIDCDGNSPLCVPNPDDGDQRTLQVRAKAYPGTRHLEILRGLGDQGIVASVCPKQLGMVEQNDYGYRPAVAAIINRLKTKLGGQCLPRQLTPDAEGNVACLILEARHLAGGDQCVCDGSNGRIPVSEEHKQAQTAAEKDDLNETAKWNCFCEIPQTSGEARKACQESPADPPQANGKDVNGWCYVDPAAGAGTNELVKSCSASEKRKVRFVGNGAGASGATLFITCSGE